MTDTSDLNAEWCCPRTSFPCEVAPASEAYILAVTRSSCQFRLVCVASSRIGRGRTSLVQLP